MRKLKTNAILMAAGAAALFLPQAQAGSFSANFNDNATPAGTYLNGQTGGGVIENGILKITKTVQGQTGGFVIEDLDADAPVYGFNFSAKVRVDSAGTPADGFSVNFGPDISETTGAGNGEYEDGVGSGLRVSFDTYSNAGEFPPSPSISLRLGTRVIRFIERSTALITTGTNFVDLNINVTPAGAVTLTYKGEKIFDNVYFTGYQGIPAGRFAIAGRTGGSTENVFFDDISITTVTTPQVGIAAQPESVTVLPGTSVTFAPVLNNVEGATFQWLKNGSVLAGETAQTLMVASPALTDSGTRYSLRITTPNNNVTTTSEAVLTVVDIPVAPTTSFDFTDTTPPAGTVLLGAGGGYIADGALHLTDAAGDQRGVFIVDDLSAGAPVYGFTANLKLLLGNIDGSTPADGFSFNFAPDITDTTNGDLEEGLGTGLTVTFDTYDNLNGGGEAPSVDVKYGGVLVAQRKLPISVLDTGDQFAPLIIRLENDGTLDVVYKGVALFSNLTIPSFSSITGGRYALAARTGGAYERVWIDDFGIAQVTTQGDLRIITQPVNKFAVVGQTVTFTAAVNDDTGVTYQWLRNGTVIPSATSANYSFVASADDNGAQYTLRATKGGLTTTSNPATVTIYPITPTVTFNFDGGTTTPAGTVLVGTVENPANPTPGYISNSGGVNDSGVLHLTDQVNGQSSAFVVQPLLSGAEVAAINVAFDVLLRRPGATPADGFSFNWDDNLPETTIGGAENGFGNGLTASFGIFNGGTGGTIAVKWNGVTLATTRLTFAEIMTGDEFRKVIIKVTTDGKLDLVYGDRVIYSGLQLVGYSPITNGKFAFYARTGGLNADQWIDNLQIQAIKSVAPLRITTEPTDALVFPGSTATFSAIVSDPAGVTYQWSRNGTPISGANSASYTTPQLALTDNNATYTLTATGPGGTATTRAAVARVVEPIAPITTPDVEFNFNASTDVPLGTSLVGHINRDPNDQDPGQAAYITPDGGVNNSGVLHLTDNHFDQAATFYVNNFDADQAVSAFTANFKLRIGGGTTTPADGTAFSWGTDVLPESGAILEEEGGGTGLIVTFDTYRNDGEQAPEFEIKWQGSSVARRSVPIDWLTTDADFANVVIRLEADGTVDVQYEGRPIFSNVQLPNFTPQTLANFAISARTGGLHANQWVDDLKIVTTSGVVGATLTATRNADGSMTISWVGEGTLQSAPTVLGPWGNVTGASNPITIPTTGTMQFFRVVR